MLVICFCALMHLILPQKVAALVWLIQASFFLAWCIMDIDLALTDGTADSDPSGGSYASYSYTAREPEC